MKLSVAKLAVGLLLTTSVFGLEITSDTIEYGPLAVQIGALHVHPNVYFSIVNNLATVIGGNLDIEGSFYVTSTNGLASAVAAVSGTIHNTGLIAFDALGANVASTFDFASIGEFVNSGSMFFGSAFGLLSPATPFTVTSVLGWENTGLMYFKQAAGNPSLVALTSAINDGLLTITNEGTICLENTYYLQTTSVVGGGCFVARNRGTVQLALNVGDLVFNFDEAQSVYLETASSTLNVLGLSLSLTGIPVIKVYGFGNGNKISINLVFIGTGYNPNTGILTLSLTPLLQVRFDIGPGYNPSNFRYNGILGLSTQIWTTQSPPDTNSIPSVCLCEDFPVPPTSTSSSASSS